MLMGHTTSHLAGPAWLISKVNIGWAETGQSS